MTLRKYLLILALFSTLFNAFSQTTVTLIISDNVTGKKLTQIDSIFINNIKENYKFKDLENGNGEYKIKSIKSSNYKIEIYCKNYELYSNNIKISYADNQRFFCKLNPLNQVIRSIILPNDAMPIYPGGNDSLMKFFERNFNSSNFKNINQKIYVGFIINSVGKVDSVEIKNYINEQVTNEIKRVFYLMPAWTPGMLNGKPVSVPYVIPIRFSD